MMRRGSAVIFLLALSLLPAAAQQTGDKAAEEKELEAVRAKRKELDSFR